MEYFFVYFAFFAKTNVTKSATIRYLQILLGHLLGCLFQNS